MNIVHNVRQKLQSCEYTSQLFLVAIFLIGMGQILFLPAFEGFDEIAHFSRIKEISVSFKSIFEKESYIDKRIVDYKGPLPYSSGSPPFDEKLTYGKFFSNPEQVANYQYEYSSQPFNRVFTPSEMKNWQNQHPPLYYALLGLIYPHIQQFTFKNQILALRAISFLIALVGIAFSMRAIEHILKSVRKSQLFDTVLLGFLIYPLALPMFFVEFGRIGNDSLCVLITGWLACQLSNACANGFNYKNSVILGSTLGLGLLTKAFFVPISIIVLAFISINLLKSYKYASAKQPYMLLVSTLIPLVIIGCGWYLWKYYSFGDLGVGEEANSLTDKASIWRQFIENFSIGGFLHGIVTPLVTYSWAGSQSLVRIPILMQFVLLFFSCCLFLPYMFYVQQNKSEIISWLPLTFFFIFYLALLIHVVIGMALTGLGASGGWYLHILFPWMALGFGLGLSLTIIKRWSRLLLCAFVTLGLTFQLILNYLQASLFAGCAIKGKDKYYEFLQPMFCLSELGESIKRLEVLSYPVQGIMCLALGLLILYIITVGSIYSQTTHKV